MAERREEVEIIYRPGSRGGGAGKKPRGGGTAESVRAAIRFC